LPFGRLGVWWFGRLGGWWFGVFVVWSFGGWSFIEAQRYKNYASTHVTLMHNFDFLAV
jgi:hypothetical protein